MKAAAIALRWWRSVYLTTGVTLFVGIATFFPFVNYIFAIQRYLHILPSLQTEQLFLMAAPIIFIFIVVRVWETRPLASFGVKIPALYDAPLALAVFVAIRLANELSTWIYQSLIGAPTWKSAGAALFAHPRWWFILWAFYAATFEELYFRGYATERGRDITGGLIAGAALGLALDLWVHVPYWGIAYLLEIVFSQVLVTLLYLWRRSVTPGLIAHLFWDLPALPIWSYVLIAFLPSLVGTFWKKVTVRLVPSNR
ncbi:MAG: CPBP family glutamic-type intramembrane protease [Candidatus Binataceae bacterium]